MKNREKYSFKDFVKLIREIDKDICVAINYDNLDILEQMFVNFTLNKQAGALYDLFSLTMEVLKERKYMKERLDYYEKLSTQYKIKIKKMLGQWREPNRPELVGMKSIHENPELLK
jgi:hypothetical protein